MNTIDLFAGGGGFSTGAAQAGANVVWAANHWPLAVEFHAENHPGAKHLCQDLQQANWSQVPSHDLLLASPCCQGHSNARGKDTAEHDSSRSTAWAVVACAEYHLPSAFVVENVPEFMEWKLFPQWKSCMEALGYNLKANILDAADFGVPQNRVRMFLTGSRGGEPVTITAPKCKQKTARDVIDFDSGKWTKVEKEGRSPATVRRWRAGREAQGERFVMPYYSSGSGLTGRSLDRPLGTVTTRDRWAVVDGDRMRMMTVVEYCRAMGFPETYKLPKARCKAIHLLGNAVCPPVARHIVRQVMQQTQLSIAA